MSKKTQDEIIDTWKKMAAQVGTKLNVSAQNWSQTGLLLLADLTNYCHLF
jgi:hypothetical protein